MKKLFIAFILLVFNLSFYSQNDPKDIEQQALHNNLAALSRTLTINISSIPSTSASDFKFELENWHEKVVSVTFNNTLLQMIIIHNGLLHPREMEDVLSKYQITKDKIVSYK